MRRCPIRTLTALLGRHRRLCRQRRLARALTKASAAVVRQRRPSAVAAGGINDIHKPGRSQAASIGPLVQALRTVVHDARSRGARVFVGTLLPEDKCGCRAFDFVDGRDDIVAANAQIRVMAANEGVVLVDLYLGFVGQTTALLSFDGLHPNEAGYAKMAEMFFEAIRQQLESGIKQGSGSPESSH